jgi:hypothetical protein
MLFEPPCNGSPILAPRNPARGTAKLRYIAYRSYGKLFIVCVQ